MRSEYVVNGVLSVLGCYSLISLDRPVHIRDVSMIPSAGMQ